MAQRVGRGIALLFHVRGTRRGWVVSSKPRPQFTPGRDLVPILQEAGWAPEPVWTGGKSRPHEDSIPDRPARSQSLYRLSYPAHPRCPEGSRKLRFPDYVTMTQDDGKVVSLTHRPLCTPRKYSWYSFLLEVESTPGRYCDQKDYVNEKFQWHLLESNQRPSDL